MCTIKTIIIKMQQYREKLAIWTNSTCRVLLCTTNQFWSNQIVWQMMFAGLFESECTREHLLVAKDCFLNARACFLRGREQILGLVEHFLNAREYFLVAMAPFLGARKCFLCASDSFLGAMECFLGDCQATGPENIIIFLVLQSFNRPSIVLQLPLTMPVCLFVHPSGLETM